MSAPRGAFSCSGNRSRRPARRSAPAARGTRRPSRPRTCIGIKAAFRQRSTRVEELSSHSILSKIDGDAATTLEKSSTCHTAPTCSRPRRAATRTRRSPPSNGRRRRGGTSSSWAASSRSNSCRAPGRTRLVGPWAAGRHSGRPSRHSADTRPTLGGLPARVGLPPTHGRLRMTLGARRQGPCFPESDASTRVERQDVFRPIWLKVARDAFFWHPLDA